MSAEQDIVVVLNRRLGVGVIDNTSEKSSVSYIDGVKVTFGIEGGEGEMVTEGEVLEGGKTQLNSPHSSVSSCHLPGSSQQNVEPLINTSQPTSPVNNDPETGFEKSQKALKNNRSRIRNWCSCIKNSQQNGQDTLELKLIQQEPLVASGSPINNEPINGSSGIGQELGGKYASIKDLICALKKIVTLSSRFWNTVLENRVYIWLVVNVIVLLFLIIVVIVFIHMSSNFYSKWEKNSPADTKRYPLLDPKNSTEEIVETFRYFIENYRKKNVEEETNS